MARLIDTDALTAAFLDYPKMLTFNGGFCAVNLDAVLLEIRRTPTIDAVPVVRCKDCKYLKIKTHIPTCYCEVWKGFNGYGYDGYCCYGERRGENDCI